jgi:hypothetical protein
MHQVREQLIIYDRLNMIRKWWDRKILPGETLDRTITEMLASCEVILMFISPSFMASDYCYDVEMKQALKQHEEGRSIVIPVILRACEWRAAPFGKFLAVPKDGRPVTMWQNRDEATKNVADGVMRAVGNLRKTAPQPTGSKEPGPQNEDTAFYQGVEFHGVSKGPNGVEIRCENCGTSLSSPPARSRFGMFCNSCGFVAPFNRNGLANLWPQVVNQSGGSHDSAEQNNPLRIDTSPRSFHVLKWFSQIDPNNGAANVDIIAYACRQLTRRTLRVHRIIVKAPLNFTKQHIGFGVMGPCLRTPIFWTDARKRHRPKCHVGRTASSPPPGEPRLVNDCLLVCFSACMALCGA